MSLHVPHVSIGLPVFQGENYLEEALQSILAQTFSDFELIISDNASTDRTQAICEAYAQRDSRIRYYHNESNVGAGPNFNRTVALARGKYFKWAAHDDLLMPDFLEKCVAVLDRDPSIVLCHTKAKEISASGEFIKNHGIELPRANSSKPHERFADLILIQHPCFDVFGLMRIDVLKKTPMIASYIGSDRVLLAELALHGRFYKIPEHLFITRCHIQQSVLAIPIHRRRHWFDTTQTDGRAFPHWRYWYEYYNCVKRTSLTTADRNACYRQLLRYPSRAALLMTKDLVTAISPHHVELIKQKNPRWLCQYRRAARTVMELWHQSRRRKLRHHS